MLVESRIAFPRSGERTYCAHLQPASSSPPLPPASAPIKVFESAYKVQECLCLQIPNFGFCFNTSFSKLRDLCSAKLERQNIVSFLTKGGWGSSQVAVWNRSPYLFLKSLIERFFHSPCGKRARVRWRTYEEWINESTLNRLRGQTFTTEVVEYPMRKKIDFIEKITIIEFFLAHHT